MSVGREWTGQLWRASGVALLAPGAVLAALVLLAFAGGFGRLGAVAQVFSGPASPPAAQKAAALVARTPTRALVALASAGGVPTGLLVRSGSRPAPGGGGTGRGGSGSGRPRPAPGAHPPHPARPVGTAPIPVSSKPPSAPAPAPKPAPAVVGEALGLGSAVAGKLPGPAGALAGGAVGTVHQLLNKASVQLVQSVVQGALNSLPAARLP